MKRRSMLLSGAGALLTRLTHAQGAASGATQPAAPPKVPVYRTTLPPAVNWAYRLQRGMLTGSGEFVWAPADGHYEARLGGRVIGITVLDWTSRGAFDGAGVAPEEYVVRRIGRDAESAQFERASGKVRFAGRREEVPLVPGMQDRLTWMVQLPAIVAAAPQRFGRGAQAQMFVVGARADADVWTFTVLGNESVDTPSGTIAALHLKREPRKARDLRAEIWLDPARHHLPVKALLANAGADDGDALELLLQSTGR